MMMMARVKCHLFAFAFIPLLLFAQQEDNVFEGGDNATVCTPEFLEQCAPCMDDATPEIFNCSLPGLESLTPGMYEGVTANYLSFQTEISSPNLPVRAKEFEACTGGSIIFSEAANVWEDPITDLGTKTAIGTELYDGYFMSYSHFPEASALGLAEHLNDRIRDANVRLKWQDVLPQVRRMGDFRSNGETNVDFLLYDGDFFVPIIRLDLLEKHDLPLPNTWDEVVELAKFFNGTDLNDDGEEDDFGICHFPRLGAGYWDWWWTEAVYSTWATFDQTEGINQGFFFNETTMEPRVNGPGFLKAAEIWKDLWKLGTTSEGTKFISGRCAIGFGPPGSWKGVFLSPDGVSRKDENGTVIWQPRMQSGEYAEPYRFKPFGSTHVVDRMTGEFTRCTRELCPKAEPIPSKGHFSPDDRANVLKAHPQEGQLINRAPFYWSGGLGTMIRKSSPEEKKDLLWDFFVYTNSAETSVYDVANYQSWLDSWRSSQLFPGNNFLDAGWSFEAYSEHAFVMQWALTGESNGALNLRLPGLKEYTRDTVGKYMAQYISGEISLADLGTNVKRGWIEITEERGKLDQLAIYRSSLNLDGLPPYTLCTLHRAEMDQIDPSVCRRYDQNSKGASVLVATLVPIIVVLCSLVALLALRRKAIDSLWTIKRDELHFGDPPEVLGKGRFGLVLLAEYRGTQVAVKQVIPPKGRIPKETVLDPGRQSLTDCGQIEGSPEVSQVESLHIDKDRVSHEEQPINSLAELREPQQGDVESNVICQRSCQSDSCISGIDSIDLVGITFLHESLGNFPRFTKDSIITKKWNVMRSLNPFRRRGYASLKDEFVREMRQLSTLRHPCIVSLMGAVIDAKNEPMIVLEYMDMGSFHDILHNETFVLDGEIMLRILRDIAQGVRFLHAANPGIIHGDLKAQNILVDSRFRAKVADFGLTAKMTGGTTGTPFYLAPELIRGESHNTAMSDVYAFGMIIYEAYSRRDPYENENVEKVLRQVANRKIQKRPPVPACTPPVIASLMMDCFNGRPDLRPQVQEIDTRLRRLVAEDVAPIANNPSPECATKIGDEVTYEAFPEHVADALREGKKVEPEKKRMVTIFFSGIVDFKSIQSKLSPEKISNLLHRLHVKLDAISEHHAAFKVETIGDTYMCVTNLVDDNQSTDHAKRMALFAMDAMQIAGETLVNVDDPSLGTIELRAGFHSGPVIASVIGSKKLRYSIFGDSVNTASCLERTSLPGRVHISSTTARILELQDPMIAMESRGNVVIKGTDEMQTYLLKDIMLGEAWSPYSERLYAN